MPGELVQFAAAGPVAVYQPGTATTPVSERVAALVKPTHTIDLYDENGGWMGTKGVWKPPAVRAQDLPDLRRQQTLLTEALRPVERPRLLARVLALLSHYPSREHPPEVERAIAEDWAEDLGEFPSWAVDEAARTWRRTKKWRPSISEMRALCDQIAAAERTMHERVGKLLIAADKAKQSEGQEAGATVNKATDVRARIAALAAAKRMV